jgi:hypothetical protein
LAAALRLLEFEDERNAALFAAPEHEFRFETVNGFPGR